MECGVDDDSDESVVHSIDLICSEGVKSQDLTQNKISMQYTREPRKDIMTAQVYRHK